MRVEYSIWKVYILVMLPIGLLVLSALWRFPNIIIAIFFVMGGIFSFPCTFIFTQVFNFDVNETGIHRKWMGTTEQKIPWKDLHIKSLPIFKKLFWISSHESFFQFPSLPSILMKNSQDFLNYLAENQIKPLSHKKNK